MRFLKRILSSRGEGSGVPVTVAESKWVDPQLNNAIITLLDVTRSYSGQSEVVSTKLGQLDRSLAAWESHPGDQILDGELQGFLDSAKQLAEKGKTTFYVPGGAGIIRVYIERDPKTQKIKTTPLE